MPYRTIDVYFDPEIMLEHKGVKIVRSYKRDEIDNPYTWHFIQEGGDEFDVRDFDTPTCKKVYEVGWQENKEEIVQALMEIIDAGYLAPISSQKATDPSVVY